MELLSAFERICSGIPGLDEALDNIRLGDNVVFQVPDLDSYRAFVTPFARQAVLDGRQLTYVRFSKDPPLLTPMAGLEIVQFNPDDGFEAFTVSIHDLITRKGREAFYIFDCLSELQVVWWADLMMGNFFRVTCPYLFELDTVAFFPILRGRHSFEAVARIRETTQLLLDIYREGETLYLYPLKVWNRYSSTMFLPKKYQVETGFVPLTDGVAASSFYALLNREALGHQDQNLDSWDRWFSQVRSGYAAGTFTQETARDLCRSMITRDDEMGALVLRHFRPEDYFSVRARMVGTGTVGGKSCGMLLAQRIVEENLPDSMSVRLEPHDSFYIGSDVFYTYIVENQCWKLRLRQKTEAGWYDAAVELQKALLSGRFPSNIEDQFRRMLDYFGQSPIIVRSSSLLEDGFGNAFAGKYESVFCVNTGSPAQRLEELEQAVRVVYASTMDPSALDYRSHRGLAAKDEQMAILVQRVSGQRYGDWFFPHAAGVGYSYSMWRWSQDLDPSAGLLRLVAGLGTRAVDRTPGDYPRLANLDCPAVTPHSGDADRNRFSQHVLDVLNLRENTLESRPLSSLLPALPRWYQNLVLEHDAEAERLLRERGEHASILFASCQGLLEKPEFPAMMQALLHILQKEYHTPVDIEFTINCTEQGDFMVNLLQCRPLQIARSQAVHIPELEEARIFFDVTGSSMGSLDGISVDTVVQVDPEGYYRLPYHQKPKVARAIGKLNALWRESGKSRMLISPGRLGTSSPELGVPARFAELSGFRCLCEVAYGAAGYRPELSYGSHMFQDLVEANIFYAAIQEDNRTRIFHPHLFSSLPNLFPELCPEYPELKEIIRVYDLPEQALWLYADMRQGRALCGLEAGCALPSHAL